MWEGLIPGLKCNICMPGHCWAGVHLGLTEETALAVAEGDTDFCLHPLVPTPSIHWCLAEGEEGYITLTNTAYLNPFCNATL